MSGTTRVAKSYTIDPDIDKYISATKGDSSASERVNELLEMAILQERVEKLGREAAAFFKGETRRTETRAFQKAAFRTLERD